MKWIKIETFLITSSSKYNRTTVESHKLSLIWTGYMQGFRFTELLEIECLNESKSF